MNILYDLFLSMFTVSYFNYFIIIFLRPIVKLYLSKKPKNVIDFVFLNIVSVYVKPSLLKWYDPTKCINFFD